MEVYNKKGVQEAQYNNKRKVKEVLVRNNRQVKEDMLRNSSKVQLKVAETVINNNLNLNNNNQKVVEVVNNNKVMGEANNNKAMVEVNNNKVKVVEVVKVEVEVLQVVAEVAQVEEKDYSHPFLQVIPLSKKPNNAFKNYKSQQNMSNVKSNKTLISNSVHSSRHSTSPS